MAEAPCRLSVFLSRKAPVAVVLRRGPSAWVQLALWHRDSDRIEPGQWFHGRVYERRCDLSPDGSLFLYFAAKHGLRRQHSRPVSEDIGEAWTAISRPPYFTALALWPNLGSWYGGGVFRTDKQLELDVACSLEPHPDFRPPPGYKFQPMAGATAPWEQRLLRDRWVLVQRGFDPRNHRRVGEREIWTKPHPEAPVALFREVEDVDFGRYGGIYGDTFWIEAGDELLPLPGVTWADWDSWERLVLVRDGCLIAARLAGMRLEEQVLYDFNPLRPEEVATPDWARRW